MSRVANAAVVVADGEVGMVVLAIGDVRERIDEAHRAVEILEHELALQLATVR